jgi:hypothetical protein
VHKFSGDAADTIHRSLIPKLLERTHAKPADQLIFTFAKQGNQGSRKTPRRTLIIDHCTPESTEWSALEKPVAPLPSPPSAGTALLSFSGAGEGI